MWLWFLIAPAVAIEVMNMEMKSSDGSLDEEWARAIFKQVVQEELAKEFGKMELTPLPDGESQHLDVRMVYNVDTGVDETKVVLVHVHADGRTTTEDIKLE